MTLPTLKDLADVSAGARCPHCGSHRTRLVRMLWDTGAQTEFWTCDDCKRTWPHRTDDGR